MADGPADRAWDRGSVVAFAVLAGLLAHDLLSFADWSPIWDGWRFLERCAVWTARGEGFDCFGHSGVLHTALMGLSQLVCGEGLLGVSLLHLGLGLGGVVALRELLGIVAGPRLSPTERTLAAFLFLYDPIVRVGLIQPSLDFPLPVYLAILLHALFRGYEGRAMVVGLAMIFTKETGVALYGSSVFVHAALFEVEAVLRPAAWIAWLRRHPLRAVPVVVFLAWMGLRTPHHDAGGSWVEALEKLVSPTYGGQRRTTLAWMGLAINFSWLLTAGALVGALAVWREPRAPWRRSYLGCALLLLVFLVLLTRIVPFVNGRYITPIRPLLVAAFAAGLPSWLAPRRLRLVVLGLLLALFQVSYFRTLDPVSLHLFGDFRFGRHRLLDVTGPTGVGVFGHGRDQLCYNSQFTAIDRLTREAYRRFGTRALYLSSWKMTWFDYEDLRSWDESGGKRRVGLEHERRVDMIDPRRLAKRLGSDEGDTRPPMRVVYLAYPTVYPQDHQGDLAVLAPWYVEAERVSLEDAFGYSMEAVVLVARSAPGGGRGP